MRSSRGARVAAIGVALLACEGAPDATEEQDSSATGVPAHERLDCDLPAAIEYCGGGTCHYDNATPTLASDLVLWNRQDAEMARDAHTQLVGVPASYHNVPDPERCPPEPELRIDPMDIERSLLVKKLYGTQLCGAQMPKFPYPEWGTAENPGAEREALVQCILDWVALLAEDYMQPQ